MIRPNNIRTLAPHMQLVVLLLRPTYAAGDTLKRSDARLFKPQGAGGVKLERT